MDDAQAGTKRWRMAWATTEKEAEMRAWEATTVAAVATTQTGQKTGLGTEDQKTALWMPAGAVPAADASRRAPWPR